MENESVEELVRIEAEGLARETADVDFCELSPEDRHRLRLRVIDMLEPGGSIFEDAEPNAKIHAA